MGDAVPGYQQFTVFGKWVQVGNGPEIIRATMGNGDKTALNVIIEELIIKKAP